MAKKEGNETAAEVYAELAAQGKGQVESPEQARIRELEARLAAAEAALEKKRPEPFERAPLDPKDKRLDEPVLKKNPKSKLKGEENAVHTYRELGVSPDDLDPGLKTNPETGQIVRCRFIKATSGNLIEMP